MATRWNKFAKNLVGIIKNEVVIQEDCNEGLLGLDQVDLLELAQQAFRRKQSF